MHLESTKLWIDEFVRTVLPHGTTAVAADPHELANVLGVAGIAALIAGGLLLFQSDGGGPTVSPWVAVPVAVVLGGGLLVVGGRVLSARRQGFRTGEDQLLGSAARARTDVDPVGQVFVEGALWRARSADGAPIPAGAEVRVEEVDGLTLVVAAGAAGEDGDR
jgi:membrane-bound ClpP family serine protease